MSSKSQESPPSLYEWAGGKPAIERLMEAFYKKVREDRLLAPIFAQMSDEHPRHVAHFSFGRLPGMGISACRLEFATWPDRRSKRSDAAMGLGCAGRAVPHSLKAGA